MPGLNDSSTALYFVVFLALLALLGGGALVARRLLARNRTPEDQAGQRGRQPRLGIVDVYELDGQRRLILLRRDDVEHLLLVGGPNDLVVESRIERPANASLIEAKPELTAPDRPIQETRPPGTRAEPTFPPPPSRRIEPFPEAVPREPSGVPAAPMSVPDRKPEAARPPKAADVPMPSPMAEASSGLDPKTLSDVAVKLEAALSDPKPTPAPDKVERPASRPQVAARPAPPSAKPASSDPAGQELAKADGPGPASEKQEASSPTQKAPSTRPPQPRPNPAPAKDAAPVPASRPTETKAPSEQDPFSVEDIEAEFARLLGRPKDAGG